MRLDERRGKLSEGREKVFYRNDDLPAVTRSSHLAAETFRDPPSPSCRQLSLPPLVSALIPSQADTNAPLPPTPPAKHVHAGTSSLEPWAGDARGGTGSSHDVSVGRRGWFGSRGWTGKRLAPASRQSSRQSPGNDDAGRGQHAGRFPAGIACKNASFPPVFLVDYQISSSTAVKRLVPTTCSSSQRDVFDVSNLRLY